MSLPFSERYKLYQPVVLTDEFEVPFPVFDFDDLTVDVDSVDEPLFSVTGTFFDGVSNDAVITLTTAVTGVDVEIYGARDPRRENDYLANSPNLSANLQRDMDAITGVQQEQTRDFSRSFKLSRGVEAVVALAVSALNRAGRVLVFSDDGLSLAVGPTTDDVASAAANATAAAQSAADAAAAEASLLKNEGEWLTATDYGIGDIVQEMGTSYHCEAAHTSGVFADDFAAGRWSVFASKGNAGAGTGDMLAENNLSDVLSASASFAAIKQNASTSVTGVVRRATSGEGATGTETQAVPAVNIVKEMIDAATVGPVIIATGRVTFPGGVATLEADSYGIASVTDNSTGNTTVTFSTAEASASKYFVNIQLEAESSDFRSTHSVSDSTRLTTGFVVHFRNVNGGVTDRPFSFIVVRNP